MDALDHPIIRGLIAQRETALNSCVVLGARIAELEQQLQAVNLAAQSAGAKDQPEAAGKAAGQEPDHKAGEERIHGQQFRPAHQPPPLPETVGN